MVEKNLDEILYEAYFNTKHEFSDSFKQTLKEYYVTGNKTYATKIRKFIHADTSYSEVIQKNKRNLKINGSIGLVFATIIPFAISNENYKVAMVSVIGTSLVGLTSACYYLQHKARKSWLDKLDVSLNDQAMYQFLDKYKKEIESKIN